MAKLDKQVMALCRYWQRTLRLQDWIIEVRLVHPDEILGNSGENTFNVIAKESVIKICDPRLEKDPKAIEPTLVHELLHLHFAGVELEYGSGAWYAQEQGIDLIALTLTLLSNVDSNATLDFE
jgi:hypothetical protein